MPVILIGVAFGLGLWGLMSLAKPRRRADERVIVAGGPAGIPTEFASESQARAYFQAQAGRIAATGNLQAIDIAMQAMRELGIAGGPEYDVLAQAAASAAPLVDPWA